MEVLFIFVLAILFLFKIASKSPRHKGEIGERKVYNKLEKLIENTNEIKLFHNLTLRTPDGSTQIDHLLISTHGIFVIETKNMSGWIFGSEAQKQWTQIIFKQKNKFQNPIHQNYKHIKAIETLLSVDLQYIFNVVVFVGDAEFKTIMPNNVIRFAELIPYIQSHNQNLFSAHDIDMYYKALSNTMKTDVISKSQHIENVHKNINKPICPTCHIPMVLRTVSKGSKKGNRFWGCAKYPTCRKTKRIN